MSCRTKHSRQKVSGTGLQLPSLSSQNNTAMNLLYHGRECLLYNGDIQASTNNNQVRTCWCHQMPPRCLGGTSNEGVASPQSTVMDLTCFPTYRSIYTFSFSKRLFTGTLTAITAAAAAIKYTLSCLHLPPSSEHSSFTGLECFATCSGR